MPEEAVFAYMLKTLFIVTSPVTFVVGVFLLYDVDMYLKIERFLARSYGSSKKSFTHQLEKNRETLQLFLLKRRKAVGIICLVNSLLAIFIVIFLLGK